MTAQQEFAGWTDSELYDYWQERVAVRFEDGQQETIEQARHMEAKALEIRLGRPLPPAIQEAANKFYGWSFSKEPKQ